ncbi:hypothetical protein CH273_25835 [Rhodococcus sp. 05-339-2]|uniref:hypothetical protein n=1 Tax=Rhodococcoides fascians TaxID=1828 RepID=UPI00050CA5C5|nr:MULTISPECIES: hypothetical protein [Rhodococcus]OZD74909.1 hypothetical protein CH273_25835 [Rhodococcus sp. 05-339-2]
MRAVFTDEEGCEYTAHRDGEMLVITRTDVPDISFAGRVEPLPAYEPVFVVPEAEPYAGIGPVLEGQIVPEPEPESGAVLAIEAQEGSA